MTVDMYKEKQVFSARSVPWMKLGTVIDKAVPAEEAMKLAGLDFIVERRPLTYPGKRGEPCAFPGRSALVRKDTHEALSSVAGPYEIVQYVDAFSFINVIDPLIVAAGSLRSGKQAFMVVQVPKHDDLNVLDGDEHELYAILRTSHDCSRAIELSIMPVRGMCMNQMPLASFSRNAHQRWSIRHVTGAQAKVKAAVNLVAGIDEYAKEYAAIADHLAEIDLELEEARKIMETVLPDRPKRDDAVNNILGRFTQGETVGYHNTGWGLVNAVGEYFEHGRRGPDNPEAQLLNALSGATTKAINRTAQVLMRRTAR